MRGAVSLAAALALPLDPAAFPERDLIIFLTFCVILATLVGQGLTLPWLVRRLGVVAGDRAGRRGDACPPGGRRGGARPARRLADEYPGHLELVDQLRAATTTRRATSGRMRMAPRDEAEQEVLDHLEIRTAVLDAEREAVIQLRDDGVISDEVLHSIERDLDLEALRSGV